MEYRNHIRAGYGNQRDSYAVDYKPTSFSGSYSSSSSVPKWSGVSTIKI